MEQLFKSRVGLGTNRIGQNPIEDLAILHYALDVGYTVIDTAEMYVDQNSERIIGQCITQRPNFDRTSIQIVTKVRPQNSIVESCLGSLSRLQCEYIDVFLLHWREDNDLESVLTDMLTLQQKGYIKHFGVSNFTVDDLEEWRAVEKRLTGTNALSVNQVKYNFNERSIEDTLIPYHQQHNIVTMAYTPLGKTTVLNNPDLKIYAARHELSLPQAALHWILQTPNSIAIPKSTNRDRLKENLDVLSKLKT